MTAQGWVAYGPMGAFGGPPAAQPAEGSTLGPPHGPDPHRRPELGDVRRLAKRGLDLAGRTARADEQPTLTALIAAHLDAGGPDAPIESQRWARYEGVNMQRALDAWLAEPGRTHRSLGVPAAVDMGLAELVAGSSLYGMPPLRPVGIARVNLASGPDEVQPCDSSAVHLVHDADGRRAVLFARLADPRHGRDHCSVEILADAPGAASAISEQLRHLSAQHNAYRGHVLSLGQDPFGYGGGLLNFHRRPELTREQLVLHDDVLASIERQVVGVARHRDALLAGGQHLKRGVLLYGPPGVGKTHTVRYLSASLRDTTVLLISGEALELIGLACSVARALTPALVVVEDVDLIAEDRGMHPGQHPLLFQLLNEMDGLAGDSDVCFLLTTNRADLLEPALAAQPGRVDQAIEIALPDLEARRRLFELYVGTLRLHAAPDRVEAVLARAEGVTASFLKELARRAALFALDRDPSDGSDQSDPGGRSDPAGRSDRTEAGTPAPTVTADDLDAAIEYLLDARNLMTRRLLGAGGDDAAEHDPLLPG